MNDTPTTNSSETKMPWGILITVGVLAALVVLAVMNRSALTELSRKIGKTQDQVNDVANQVEESKDAMMDEAADQAQQVADSMLTVDNPIIRLLLLNAYKTRIANTLTSKTQNDLNTVIVFVQKQPTVLLQPTSSYPADIQTALSSVASAAAKLKASVAATAQTPTQPETANPVVGQTATITGEIRFVAQDPILGGSYFQMNQTNYGQPFFFYLNPTTSSQVMADMEGQVVSVEVEITSVEDGYVTYTVTSGPTLATDSMMDDTNSMQPTVVPTTADDAMMAEPTTTVATP